MPGGLDEAQQAAWTRDAAFLAQLQDASAAVTILQKLPSYSSTCSVRGVMHVLVH